MKKYHHQSVHIHLFSLMLIAAASARLTKAQDTVTPIHVDVGVILDMETWVAKVSTSCMNMALSDFYAIHAEYKTRLVLHTRDSKLNVITAAFAAMDLVNNSKVQMIIGPQKSEQTEFIVNLGDKVHIPIISFSATRPSLYSRSPYFIRTTPDDHTQVRAIASIAQAFQWRKVILIHEDTDYGNRLVQHLMDAFQEINTRISNRSVISTFATDDQIFSEIQKLIEMQTRVFIVHMSASFGAQFFLKAKKMKMMTEGYVWIVTNGIMNVLDSLEPSVTDSMQGVLGVKAYIPRTERLDNFITRWKQKFTEENSVIENAKMVSFGLQAYDTIWALAMAAENVGVMKFNIKPEMEGNNVDLLSIGVSKTGPMLLDEILKTEFVGLSGDFRLVNGQLQPSAFQILNVIDKGGREIGFWTSMQGISRNLDLNSDKTYSTSSDQLQDVIWPGKSTTKPKGWVIPMKGKKLRIGVPVQDGFSQLVNVKKDPHTNATIVTGYCIDVFNSVMESLPYTIPYEFLPFQSDDGKSYNDLIYQVYIEKYDAVVGDTTITANRSLYVDFAFPYTNGGVWMIVPLKPQKKIENRWMLLQPLTKDFGISSMAIFIVMTFLVWVLEQRQGNGFRGASSFDQPVKKILHFTLTMITPEYRKKVTSIMSKLVVIVWLFLLLRLASNNVVTLTSLITPEQLEPTVTDFNDLIKNGEFVGYRQGSFLLDLLKRFRFDESKLKPYSSPEECDELLSKGSQNGGVAAVFAEMPYINIFFAKYCSKYTKVGPTHKTDGFGFVFPKGSPLVSDISKAILKVTEGNKLMDIERNWFETKKTCEEDPWDIFTSTNPYILLQMSIFTLALSLLITSSIFNDTTSSKRHFSKQIKEVTHLEAETSQSKTKKLQ